MQHVTALLARNRGASLYALSHGHPRASRIHIKSCVPCSSALDSHKRTLKPGRNRPHRSTQELDDLEALVRLTAHPHRDLSQIARILGKMDIPFNTYSDHLAQIRIQRSTEAFRDGDAAVQVSFHFLFESTL